MGCGLRTEIRLFDPRRNPRDWTDLIRPTECAVFLKDRTTSAPRAPDGQPFHSPGETTCVVFDHFDGARQFCAAKVQTLPQLRCEIYDGQGLAHPPLLVIIHPDHQQKEDSSSSSSRTRKFVAAGLFLIRTINLDGRAPRQYPGPAHFSCHQLHSGGIALPVLGFCREAPGARASEASGGASRDGPSRCHNSNCCSSRWPARASSKWILQEPRRSEPGYAPGNVLVPARAAGLARDAVVNVSQLLALHRSFLTEHAGTLPPRLQRSVDEGLRTVLQL